MPNGKCGSITPALMLMGAIAQLEVTQSASSVLIDSLCSQAECGLLLRWRLPRWPCHGTLPENMHVEVVDGLPPFVSCVDDNAEPLFESL